MNPEKEVVLKLNGKTDMNESIKILMVEDDPNLGYLLKENFAPKGIDILLSENGEEGFKFF